MYTHQALYWEHLCTCLFMQLTNQPIMWQQCKSYQYRPGASVKVHFIHQNGGKKWVSGILNVNYWFQTGCFDSVQNCWSPGIFMHNWSFTQNGVKNKQKKSSVAFLQTEMPYLWERSEESDQTGRKWLKCYGKGGWATTAEEHFGFHWCRPVQKYEAAVDIDWPELNS